MLQAAQRGLLGSFPQRVHQRPGPSLVQIAKIFDPTCQIASHSITPTQLVVA